MKRDMIFISHASEDSQFTMWLALQLAKSGYGVWCDLTKLLGGENWPQEINEALHKRTQKFLYVLSKTSNTKLDPLNEFEVARKVAKETGIKNFIIPVKIDDLTFDQMDFRFQSYQCINVGNSWAQGLIQVLKVLQKDEVPRNNSFHPGAVREWWTANMSGATSLVNNPEVLQSNRFSIVGCPNDIFAHRVGSNTIIEGQFSFPFFVYKGYLISFLAAADLDPLLQRQVKITESFKIRISDLIKGNQPSFATIQQGEYILSRMLNQAFLKSVSAMGYRAFSLSRSRCIFFDGNKLPQGRIVYTNNGELDPRLTLWGRYYGDTWHLALLPNFVRLPAPHYCIRTTVLLRSKGKLRAAPKGVYKLWWNKTWRDRLRAAMLHLAEGKEELHLSIGKEQTVRVESLSDEFRSPISYLELRKSEDEFVQF